MITVYLLMGVNIMNQSRRSALKRLLGLGMAPMFLPKSVIGANDRVTVGMIGVGRQTIFKNILQFFEMPDVQIVAVCDVDSWRLDKAKTLVNRTYRVKRASEIYDGCAAYEDYRELLDRNDIDAVMNATPDHWHVPISMDAIRKGKDVSCEKPLTLSIAEGRLLSDLVTKHKRVFRTDSEFRSIKSFHRAVELVRNGRIGTIHTIRTGVPSSDVGCEPQPVMPVPKELNYDLWDWSCGVCTLIQKNEFILQKIMVDRVGCV
jgi:myo-inositol 2-dehydrogenase/D-chiro-inositol 1-dehydrogenase